MQKTTKGITMKTEIQEGITFININNDYYNLQHMPKDVNLYEVIIEFKEFLKACGYSDKQVDEYIDVN